MPPRFLDTNIFLRYFTRDDEEKAARAFAILLRVEAGEETVETALPVIFETVYTLQKSYSLPRDQIRDRVTAVLLMSGLRLPERDVCIDALEIFAGSNVSFADAYTAAFMRWRGLTEVYSWDRDFDRFEWVERVEP